MVEIARFATKAGDPFASWKKEGIGSVVIALARLHSRKHGKLALQAILKALKYEVMSMLPCFHKQVRGFLIDASSAQKAELADNGNKMASSPLTQQSLSPLEVERICRAFIRLLLAQEIPANGNSDQNYKDIPA